MLVKPTQPSPTDTSPLSSKVVSAAASNKVFFFHHTIEFAMVLENKNEATKVLCNGQHLITEIWQCPQHELLMCRKCCFPPEVIIPTTCPDHKVQVFHDKLAGRLIFTQQVRCPTKDTFNAACPWSGQYSQVTSHLDDCTFVPSAARVAMQNAMLKAADRRAVQKYEELKKETAHQISQVKKESDDKVNAMERLLNQRNHTLMEKNDELETRLNNLAAQLAELRVTTTASAVVHAASSSTVIAEEPPRFYDGTLLWKITNWSIKYQRAKSNLNHHFLESPPFYTSKDGYKMRMRLYPNGDREGKGTHVSVYLQIMKGEFDAILPWPFRRKITVMLLDQSNEVHHIDAFRPNSLSNSFHRPEQECNRAIGMPMFIPQEYLNRYAYLRDDTMFFKAVVNPDYSTLLAPI